MPRDSPPHSLLPLIFRSAVLAGSFYVGYSQVDAPLLSSSAVSLYADLATTELSSLDSSDNSSQLGQLVGTAHREYRKHAEAERLRGGLRRWDGTHGPHLTHKRLIRYGAGLAAAHFAAGVLDGRVWWLPARRQGR
jgi:hypothetical protein